MGVSIDDIKQLRERTAAGMNDCKKALEQSGGDMTKAEELLRVQRKTIAEKKAATREAGVGVIHTYTHMNGRIGVMVELRCETDFVARNEAFQTLLKDLCLQIAATNPIVLERAQLDSATIEKERDIFMQQARDQGKPEAQLSRIVDGMMDKLFYQSAVLLEQPFVKDPTKRILDLVTDLSGKTGEKLIIRRFSRFEV